MSIDDPYEDLPEDPEEAFLHLENFFLDHCEYCVRNADERDSVKEYYVEYISKVIAAANELGVKQIFAGRDIPDIVDVDYRFYTNFKKDVEHYKTSLKIRHARRKKGYSVSFDVLAKSRINHHIAQIRDIVTKISELDERKRESLFRKIEDLQNEVDRNRTRYDALAALVIETSGNIGEAAERGKILDLIDRVSKIFWKSKQEEPLQIGKPVEKKLIAPPQRSQQNDLDDEIPF